VWVDSVRVDEGELGEGEVPPLSWRLDLGLIGPKEELFVTRPSKFAPEFKPRAIDLYRSSEGRTIADVARELGIGTETFRRWVRQDEPTAVSGMTG
jgi:transposase